MSEAELTYECQVCYKRYGESELISVDKIEYKQGHRVFPWHICYECAEKISDAFREKEN